MKTDREFLDGIYEKAKLIEKSDDFENVTFLDISSNYSKRAKFQLIASLSLVLLTGIGYSNSNLGTINKMEIPQNIESNYQHLWEDNSNKARSNEPMVMSLGEDLYYNPIEQAEVILTAKVNKIEKSVYNQDNNTITTNVCFELNETLKGAIESDFKVLINGGYDENQKVYLDYETVFDLDEEVLLFLETSHSNNDLYILAGASIGKFSAIENDLYINQIGEIYTIDDLKSHLTYN